MGPVACWPGLFGWRWEKRGIARGWVPDMGGQVRQEKGCPDCSGTLTFSRFLRQIRLSMIVSEWFQRRPRGPNSPFLMFIAF